MSERRRKYSPEFKDEAVKMVIESSRPIADVAREIHLNETTLGNWVANIGVSIQVASTDFGGCQGFPVMASRSAVRMSLPCLRTVEMYPRTRSQLAAPVAAR